MHRKDAALDALDSVRARYIRIARRALLQRLLADGSAAVDDIRDSVEFPLHINPKFLGAVPGALVRAGVIARIGYRPSHRPEAHARPVSMWTLLDPGGAEAWLRDNPEPIEPGETTDRPRPHDEGPILY
jgi:hypothetical protein